MLVKIDSINMINSLRTGHIIYQHEKERYVVNTITPTHIFLFLFGGGLSVKTIPVLDMLRDNWHLVKPDTIGTTYKPFV
ncbi:MAG TPA: hypothetical protein VKR32_16425 [Puia sp.]|nr:hypothetical protein [Puia sp.]